MARHLVSLHYKDPPKRAKATVSAELLTDYISYAKQVCHPVLGEEAGEELAERLGVGRAPRRRARPKSRARPAPWVKPRDARVRRRRVVRLRPTRSACATVAASRRRATMTSPPPTRATRASACDATDTSFSTVYRRAQDYCWAQELPWPLEKRVEARRVVREVIRGRP